MCKAHLAARALLVPILFSGMSWAQAVQGDSHPAPSKDAFAAWHANLNDAADRALAAAVADRAWMRSATAAGEDHAASAARNSIVRLRAAIQRVQLLRPTIEPVLGQQGVPAQLSAVALVESGGQVAALSPKGARGIWQFMPETARRYGLVVGPGKDERIDVLKSTRAAARYLRDLHDQFGSWTLALAAYNTGEDTVRRAIERAGTSDFAEFSRFLPAETRSYVPAVFAAAQRIVGSQAPDLVLDTRRSEAGRRVYASSEVRN